MVATITDIDKQISALDAAVLEFSGEADELALAAVSGDASAAAALAEINRKIDGARRDRDVLVRARRSAIEAKDAERERLGEDARQRHLADARLNVSSLLDIAKRIDNLTADLKAALGELQATETNIHRSLSAARAPADGVVVGRRGLAVIAATRLTTMTDGAAAYRDPGKPIQQVARVAWRDLLIENERD